MPMLNWLHEKLLQLIDDDDEYTFNEICRDVVYGMVSVLVIFGILCWALGID